ncbi:rhodanese-like domain-containing protein [Streptomyces albiaxialis]|uniref:Rhodanese-like domain-containing protein n=1 Tax=Streptomyces albiaxialis TaxID=329523 RepID=A0ABP5HKD0_9ACTN
MSDDTTLTVDELRARRAELTLIDVRTPGEYAGGHVPGAHNIPLDRLDEAEDTLRLAAARGPLALVCASGNRSLTASRTLREAGIAAASVEGGTRGWADAGHPLDRPALPEGARPRWPMERQVRLAAGSLVLLGLGAGLAFPRARLLSAGIGAGLVYSAVSDSCGLAAVLAKLPYNRGAACELSPVLDRLARDA